MGKLKVKKMKFVAALIASVSAQTCTAETAADDCADVEAGCCGFLTDAEGAVTNVCSDDGVAPAEGEEGTFSCDDPAAGAEEEEGSTKLVLGAAALATALYM